MKVPSINITILLLIPALIESIDASLLLVNIPGSPLSLGRLCFVLAGIINLDKIKHLRNNKIFTAFKLIILGMFIGSFFSPNLMEALSRTIAFGLLIFSAAALSFSWRKEIFKYLVNFFMIGIFTYWTIYAITNLFSGNTLLDYSILFQEDKVINHHIIGILISTSAIYLASYLFTLSKIKIYIGYFVIITGFTICLMIESRSNALFTLIVGFMIYLINKKVNIKFLVISVPLLIVFVTYFFNYFSDIDSIYSRFNLTDTEYQSRTTQSRFTLIKLCFESLLEYPLGKGINNIKLYFGNGNNFLVHNQYLTFIIAGGIFAIIGVVIWIRNTIKISKLIFLKKWKHQVSKFETALVSSIIVFFLTLTSIDNSALFFFFQLSFLIYLMSRYREVLHNFKHKINK